MKSLSIPLCALILLLTGCAGVNSEFECNATTSDSCMTMEEANQKAKSMTDTSKAAPAAGVSQSQDNALPELALTSEAVAPTQDDRLVFTPIQRELSLSEQEKVEQLKDVLKNSAGYAEKLANEHISKPLTTLASCTVTACPQEKKITAHRISEGVARLWVASYVDADDVLHQPGYIQFVVKPSTWQQIQSVN